MPLEDLDRITGAEIALDRDRQVEARAPAREEALDHVRATEADAQLVAGEPRLCDDQLRRANLQTITEMHVLFEQPLDRQILAEVRRLQIDAGKLSPPERVVLVWIRIDRLGAPTVDRRIGLPVAGEIVIADRNASGDGRLEDRRAHEPVIASDLARLTNVYAQHLHGLHRTIVIIPKAVLFDLDDTILDDSGCVEHSWTDACQECCTALGVDGIASIRSAIRDAGEWFWSDPERHRVGRLDMKVARRSVAAEGLQRVGIVDESLAKALAVAYARHRDRRIALLPGALDTVRRFKAAGCALALVTNGSRRTQRMKIERFGLEPIFDAILVEGELGFGKPDPRVYELALSRLGSSPAETWMVGDHLEWDVAAPQQLGIYGVWVDAPGKGVPRGSPVRPDMTVRSITELHSVAAG
jgi:HAD superfamily hydrolase (TIGR01509 family)